MCRALTDHDLFYCIFDYYAALGTSDDITHMSMNAFGQFVGDCQLADKKSQFCKTTHFDQLFISVDSSGAGGKTDEKYNRKKALNRQEFLQCIVKIACMRYVQPGVIVDVSEALHRLFSADLEPSLDQAIFVEPNGKHGAPYNASCCPLIGAAAFSFSLTAHCRLFRRLADFRSKFCYCEEVDTVLRKHENSLRLIYERACQLRGQSLAKGAANKLVGFDEWKDVCRMFELIDADLTERDVTLAFVWSRMRVVDEQGEKGRVALCNLSFEDFLEALCRCSVCKAWPTHEEIQEAESGNAGVHIVNMRRDEPDAYAELLATRAVPWGGQPMQHISYCIENLCSYLITMCEQGKGDGKAISRSEVNAFMTAAAAS